MKYLLFSISARIWENMNLWSKRIAKSPFSESREPGWTWDWNLWKLYPVFQSQKWIVPLSAPDTKTPSWFRARAFRIALCPERFWNLLSVSNTSKKLPFFVSNLKHKTNYRERRLTEATLNYQIISLCNLLRIWLILIKDLIIIANNCLTWMNSPSGHFHCLILSALALPNEYCVGCITRDLILFLWFVRVARVFPATISHNLILVKRHDHCNKLG